MSDVLDFPRSMGPVDAMFWRLESERSLRSTTVAVALLATAPDSDLLRASVRRACGRIPRLCQRVVELPPVLSTPVWSADPDFDLDYHLRWIAAPGKGDLQSLLDLAASMAMQAFDRSRPLWEFVVVEGLEDGRAALIQKLHHSIGDGAAGLALLGEIYDVDGPARPPAALEPDPRPEDEEPAEGTLELAAEALRTALEQQPRAALRLLESGIAALRDPMAAAERAVDEVRAVGGIMDSGPGPLSSIMTERSSRTRYASFCVPVDGLRAAAKSQGCKFNDAFLAALTGGLARYHERRGVRADELRGAIPVSMRSDDAVTEAGNRLAIARFEAPMREPDPAERMRTIRARIAEQRNAASLGAFGAIANLVNVTPLPIVLPLVLTEMRKSDFVATALPGPATRFHLAGSQVDSLIPFGPTAGAALNVSLLSYADQAIVGVTMDAAAIPDRELMLSCLREGFDEISALA